MTGGVGGTDCVELWTNMPPDGRVWLFVLLTVGAALTTRYVWRRALPIITSRTGNTLDERIAAHTTNPVSALILLFGLWQTAGYAKDVGHVSETWLTGAQFGLKIATIYAVSFTANGVIQAVLNWYSDEIAPNTQTQLDDDFLPLIRRVAFILIAFVATAIALDEMGKDITALVATASVASLAVALAAQDTLSNMISGFMIMIDRPFRAGDRIEFNDGKIGDVLEIGMRSTRILSFDNHVLVVPNKELANDRIINYKLIDTRGRLVQNFGVAYSSDVTEVKRIVLDIVNANPEILPDPAPQVFLMEFGNSALEFQLWCWIRHYENYWIVKDQVNTAIKAAFDRHNISIPFPQQEVRVIGLPDDAPFIGARQAAAGKE